eukprot:TRINITY_DN587_c0_g1_i2.p1 TRINITY_DN587_c0_g1~~TRINITY_DN587_c0_g1_i2.p1  ORF type:complete len:206 (-),score=25.89 TRINITY_DN587_c0_g1_i2:76-627(-)
MSQQVEDLFKNTGASLDTPHDDTAWSTRLRNFGSSKLSERRAWTEFVGGKERYKPPTPKDALPRIQANLSHFAINYVCMFFILCIYCFITSPLSLLSPVVIIGLWVYFLYVVPQPVTFTRPIPIVFTDTQRNAILSVISLLIFYFSSVGAVVFWLIGATLTVVAVHSVMYVPAHEIERETMFQ